MALEELLSAVTGGRTDAVTKLLAAGADPKQLDKRGIAALHVAAAGASPLLERFVTTELDAAALEATDGPFADIATALLDAGADPNVRTGPAGFTPLMIATCFGQRAVAELLRARGAEPELRDTLGRTAERFAVFPLIARLIRLCRRLEMVNAVYVAQIHAPVTHQFTSAAVGLELTAPLPGDAFADWPADLPLVAFGLGEDAMSRLVRLTPPVHARSSSGGPKGPFARTLTLRFEDPRPAYELKYALEKKLELLLPLDRSIATLAVFRGRRWYSSCTLDATLVFESEHHSKRTYAMHVTLTAAKDSSSETAFAETVAHLDKAWRKDIVGIRDGGPPATRGERYAADVREAIEAEDAAIASRREDPAKIDALKREVFEAMERGRLLSSWNKDGGTEIRWVDGCGVVEESDHREVWRRDEFRDRDAFLAMVRTFFSWELGRDTHPHPPLESEAWEWLIRRLHGR